MRSRWLLMAAFALQAAASEFGDRYPAGSIQDGVQAQAALKNADAETARITQSARARDAMCLQGFFVNSCRDDVRREKELAEREVRRVRVEARDAQRRIDAERIAKRQADEKAARADEDALRPQKEAKARDAAKARAAEAKQREATATNDGESTKAGQSDEHNRSRHSPPRLTADQRAENVRKYQQKQEQAQKRALEQEAKRKDNERRRAEKRKQIEQQEAAREEIRKKAAESIK